MAIKLVRSEKGRQLQNEAFRRYAARNKDKRKAKNIVMGAIRNGSLIRASCEVCGKEKAEAHHDDYSKPLAVRWLCRTHHREFHRLNAPKGARKLRTHCKNGHELTAENSYVYGNQIIQCKECNKASHRAAYKARKAA